MTRSGKVVPESSFRDESTAFCCPLYPCRTALIIHHSVKEASKLVTEMVWGHQKTKWPQNAGTVVSPLRGLPCRRRAPRSVASPHPARLPLRVGVGRRRPALCRRPRCPQSSRSRSLARPPAGQPEHGGPARLSPLGYSHVNMLGRYEFALPDSIARGAFRPLRDPRAIDDDAPDAS